MSKGLKAFKNIMKVYGETNSLEGTYNSFLEIRKELERLEELEKENQELRVKGKELLNDFKKYKRVIEWLKNTFEITLDSKLRISDEIDCVQAFPIDIDKNVVIYDLLEEVLGK